MTGSIKTAFDSAFSQAPVGGDVDKSLARVAGAILEQRMVAVENGQNSGTMVFGPRADLYAWTWPEGATKILPAKAEVWADSNPSYTGVYQNTTGDTGAGAWTKIAELPFDIIPAVDSGAGTANAIQITAGRLPMDGAVISFAAFRANTSEDVTVEVVGGNIYDLRTAGGAKPSVGAIAVGMVLLGRIDETDGIFRLATDTTSVAIQVASEAARDLAKAYASAPEDEEVDDDGNYSAKHYALKAAEADAGSGAAAARDEAVAAKNIAVPAAAASEDFAEAAAASSAAAQLAAANAHATALLAETWSALSAIAGTEALKAARVLASDTDTHTDPVVGGTVPNAGEFRWSTSPAGWKRIGSGPDVPNAAINLVENGNLANNGDGVSLYGPSIDARWDSVVVPVTEATLTKYDCAHAVECTGPVADGNHWGNLVSTPCRLVGGSLLASVLIYDPTGNFNFGTSQGIGLYARYSDGTDVNSGLQFGSSGGVPTGLYAYEVLSSMVRRYYTTLALDPSKACMRIDFGINDANNSRPATLYQTGFWVSWSPEVQSIDKTFYPDWQACSVRSYRALRQTVASQASAIAANASAIAANADAIASLGSGGFYDLKNKIRDQLSSIHLTLIGDSNTWGVIETGSATQDPSTQALSDPRQNTTARTWANLVRDFLGLRVCSGKNKADTAPGEALYYEDVVVDPIRNPEFGVYVTSSGAKTTYALVTDRYTGSGTSGTFPTLAKFADIAVGNELQFDFIGDQLLIYHGSLSTGGATAAYDVYIDGVLNTTFSSYSSPSLFNQHDTITGLAFGKHSVRLVPEVYALRIEAIGIRRKVIVTNNGIIGTNTVTQWNPSGSISLAAAIPETSTHIMIMLGTNDRQNTAAPPYPSKTADNIEAILDWIATNRPAAKVMLCGVLLCQGTSEQGGGGDTTYYYHSSEVNRAIRNLARRKGLSFLDVFAKMAIESLKGNSWLGTDNIHFNSAGHMHMFELIADELR